MHHVTHMTDLEAETDEPHADLDDHLKAGVVLDELLHLLGQAHVLKGLEYEHELVNKTPV